MYFGRYWGEKIVFLKLMHKYNRVKQKSSFITFLGVFYSGPVRLAPHSYLQLILKKSLSQQQLRLAKLYASVVSSIICSFSVLLLSFLSQHSVHNFRLLALSEANNAASDDIAFTLAFASLTVYSWSVFSFVVIIFSLVDSD